ncbi:MAG: acetyltransferase [Nonlabens sp.]|uniref:acetyltransferase n=1 Tax=Nonlabens sp. TaxID=1888209 RepID=UPI003EF7446A
MEQIVIVGAGGFGREVKFIIDRLNQIKPSYELLGFYDDNPELSGLINGVPFLGTVDDLFAVNNPMNVVMGIGIPAIKELLNTKLKSNPNLKFPSIIDPLAIIGNDNVVIGNGCVICAGVIITCDIVLKDFVTLNLSCTVGHDTLINSYASFMPSVNISGEVVIHKAVYVGTGAKIINQLEIGESTIVGAGAVVSKSLPAKCTAVGIPAKPIKFHD